MVSRPQQVIVGHRTKESWSAKPQSAIVQRPKPIRVRLVIMARQPVQQPDVRSVRQMPRAVAAPLFPATRDIIKMAACVHVARRLMGCTALQVGQGLRP